MNYIDLYKKIQMYGLTKVRIEVCEECGGEVIVYEQRNTGGAEVRYCKQCKLMFGDVVETNYSKFKKFEEKYYLKKVYDEVCPNCNGTLTFYKSKYSTKIGVEFCADCNLVLDEYILIDEENTCEICGEMVAYDDSDINNYIKCYFCDNKVHLSCYKDIMCEDCKTWLCMEHYGSENSGFFMCNECGSIHSPGCKNIKVSNYGEENKLLCNNCFNREQDMFNQIKSNVKELNVLENIEKNKKFYVIEARENSDLTIALTHLVKSEDSYETLKDILNDKRLIAHETGYYKHLENTKAVCFADLTIRGLLRHSIKYSAYGLAFLKETIFNKGGGPVLYINDKYLENAKISSDIKPFINKLNLKNCDYHHEREWRVTDDFEFEYFEIAVLYAPLKHHEELRKLYPQIKNIIDLDSLQLL